MAINIPFRFARGSYADFEALPSKLEGMPYYATDRNALYIGSFMGSVAALGVDVSYFFPLGREPLDTDLFLVWDSQFNTCSQYTAAELSAWLGMPDITGQDALGTVADADELLIWDADAAAHKKVTAAVLATYMGGGGGSGADEKVATSSGETPGYLTDVLAAGTGISLSESGGVVTVTATGGGAGGGVPIVWKGDEASLPSSGLTVDSFYLATNKNVLYAATGADTMVPVLPPYDPLPGSSAAMLVDADGMLVWDASGGEWKRLTFGDVVAKYRLDTWDAPFMSSGYVEASTRVMAAADAGSGNQSLNLENLLSTADGSFFREQVKTIHSAEGWDQPIPIDIPSTTAFSRNFATGTDKILISSGSLEPMAAIRVGDLFNDFEGEFRAAVEEVGSRNNWGTGGGGAPVVWQGLEADLPATGLSVDSLYYATDSGALYVATATDTTAAVFPPVFPLEEKPTRLPDTLIFWDDSVDEWSRTRVGDFLEDLRLDIWRILPGDPFELSPTARFAFAPAPDSWHRSIELGQMFDPSGGSVFSDAVKDIAWDEGFYTIGPQPEFWRDHAVSTDLMLIAEGEEYDQEKITVGDLFNTTTGQFKTAVEAIGAAQGWGGGGGGTGTDEKVATSSGATPDYLSNVLLPGDGITITEEGGLMTVAADGGGSGSSELPILVSETEMPVGSLARDEKGPITDLVLRGDVNVFRTKMRGEIFSYANMLVDGVLHGGGTVVDILPDDGNAREFQIAGSVTIRFLDALPPEAQTYSLFLKIKGDENSSFVFVFPAGVNVYWLNDGGTEPIWTLGAPMTVNFVFGFVVGNDYFMYGMPA